MSEVRRRLIAERLVELRASLDEIEQRILILSNQRDDEPHAADLQGRVRRIRHLRGHSGQVQEQIAYLEDQLVSV